MIRRILLVDDEPAILVGISELLESAGFEVYCLDRGALVVPAIRQFAPDVIILDLTLPDASGIDVYASIRREARDLPVIFATGYADDDRLTQIVAAGGVHVLQKPYEFEALLAILRRLG